MNGPERAWLSVPARHEGPIATFGYVSQSGPDRVDRRAELLPEERAAGSDNPREQAEEILEESDERTEDPEGTRAESEQTPG